MSLSARGIGLVLAGLLVVSAETADGAVLASAPAEKVPPKEWARSVCTSVDEWKSSIEDLVESVLAEVSESTNLSQARDTLVTFLGDSVQATDTLLEELRQAGVPRIKNGSKIARLFKDAFTDVRELFADGEKSTRNLSVTDATQFRTAALNVGDTITRGGNRLERTFETAARKYKAANRALDDPACRSVSA